MIKLVGTEGYNDIIYIDESLISMQSTNILPTFDSKSF